MPLPHRWRSALYMPASNPRALAKAPGLGCDLLILDLEDAVREEAKGEGRSAAVAAVASTLGKPAAIRVNGSGTAWHDADVAAVAASAADLVVLPKVESAEVAAGVAARTGKPLLAMIETPIGVLNAAAIARSPDVVGLIAGTNDLAVDLRLPAGSRAGLALALQTIVLAARAAGGIALDGVWNLLDAPDGLIAECGEGRSLGFDGKTLIHPNQIAAANRAYGPSDAELEDARALVAAATGGAERFRGRMIETMHVEAARRLLDTAAG